MLNEAQLIGVLAGTLVTIGSLWQLYKIIKTKDVSAIRYPWLIFVNISLLLWMGYGMVLNDWIIIIPNIVIPILYTIFMIIKYRQEKSSKTALYK